MQQNLLIPLCIKAVGIRPREIFREFSALWFLKNLGQFLSALAISGHSERFSPGQNGPEVGGPEGLWLTTGPPTLGPFWPGENLSEWPEIARALRNWPKFFKNHRAENSRKISRGLLLSVLFDLKSYDVQKNWFVLFTISLSLCAYYFHQPITVNLNFKKC